MGEASALVDRCTCNEERLMAVMRQFPASELADLVEPDGFLHVRCQFCSRTYLLPPDGIGAA
jgi:molecular chaperone Hsp33